MAICSNNSYVVFAVDPIFNGTYTKNGSDIINGEEFSRYISSDNITNLFVQKATNDIGSPVFWTIQRRVGFGNVAGYYWPYHPIEQSCPNNFSMSNGTINLDGRALITTPQSLRSTRQKLYVYSTAEYEGSTWSGEYALQPDTYNNFSWWKNEATQAVIVYGIVNYSGGFAVSYYIFKNKTEADLYFAGSTSNIFFAQSNFYEVKDVITPFEFNGLNLDGTSQGQRGNTIISYEPFKSPLPQNEDYDALVGFFGRPGVSFDYNDLDKYGLYTFKAENGIWRGMFYRWDVDLNNASASGNLLFLEWIKSLRRKVDYEINGKKIFLNKKSEKLKSIIGFYGSATLELSKIDTSSLALERFRVASSKINTIVLGDVEVEVSLSNVTNLNSEPIDLELKGTFNGGLILSAGLDFNSFVVQKTNAFAGLTTFIDNGALDLLDSNTQEALIEKLAESEAVITARLNDLFTDNKIEVITKPAVKEKVLAKKVIVLAKIASGSGSGSGSGGSGGGVGINVLDYITNDADKIIWDYMEDRFEPFGNYLLKTTMNRPLISTEIKNIVNFGGANYFIIYPPSGILGQGGGYSVLNPIYLKPQQYSINSSTSVYLSRDYNISSPGNYSDFISVVETYSSDDAAVAAIQKYENTTGLYFYNQNHKASRTPKKLLPAPNPDYYEMYDDGKIYRVQGSSSSPIKYNTYSTHLNILTGVGDTEIQGTYTLFATGAYDMFAERRSAPVVLKQNNNIEIFYPYLGQRLQHQLPNSLTKEDVKNIVINTISYPADIRIHLLDNSGNLYYSNTLTSNNSTVPWQIKDTGVRQITYNDSWYCVGITNNFDLKKYENINFAIYPSGEIVSGNKYRLISPKYAIRHFE
jgi:hypothetical protein